MTSEATRARVPPHLRPLIVEQEYARYTAIDQAVWRFVLLQTRSRLLDTAHPAYRRGLEETGISLDRIPSIAAMDRCLAPFGWGAVAVDGFIPPRAFQEFQALGVLPIAAEMRRLEHLVYTPAPDIIHEAAGHAPIIPDPVYASYLRRAGAVGARAFALPSDARRDRAVHLLSALKEDPSVTPEQVADAERELLEAERECGEASEAVRLSRLYWWTAEYGLVGTPHAYKLYGAGLLSSLGESHSCHDPAVRKRELSADALDVPYDITRPQPQLFVARDFQELHDVLDRAERQLASYQGGEAAVAMALRAREMTTFELAGGSRVSGVPVARLEAGGVTTAILLEHSAFEGAEPAAVGTCLLARVRNELDAAHAGDRVEIAGEGGARLVGTLVRAERTASGAPARLRMRGALLAGNATLELGPETEVVLMRGIVTAYPGALPGALSESVHERVRVPRERERSSSERALTELYERAHTSFARGMGADAAAVVHHIHEELVRRYPDEWLLRWNLLEALVKLDAEASTAVSLRTELEHLEIRYRHREPIATGLAYLERLARTAP